MTEHQNKDTTPPVVQPTLPLNQNPPQFIVPILTPPGFIIPQGTLNSIQYQNWINYSTACALQQFYWSQLLASLVTPSGFAVIVPNEEGAPVVNIFKMEDLQQSGDDQSHHPQKSVTGGDDVDPTLPLNLTVASAVKSTIAVDTRTTDSPSSVTLTTTPAPVAVQACEDNLKIEPKKLKDFICKVCNRRFGYKHVLKNHMRTHTGEKPYKCGECQRKFARLHHLKTHMRRHTGEQPYECTDCKRKFAQIANLRRHGAMKHQKAAILQPQEKFHKPEVGSSSLEKQ